MSAVEPRTLSAARRLIIVTFVVVAASVAIPRASSAVLNAADDEAIESGREALGGSWTYPWYDGGADDLRRINVRPARQMQGWNMPAFTWFGMSWLELVAWAVGLSLLGLLSYLLIKAYLKRERGTAASAASSAAGVSSGETARVEALPFQIKRGANDLLAEARRNYEQGNYGEAMIYLFSHQLIELDRNQVIRLAKGKTNRQYLRETERRAALRPLLEQTMILFEDVFFGGRELGRERFEACWRRLGDFERLLHQGAV